MNNATASVELGVGMKTGLHLASQYCASGKKYAIASSF